MTKLKIGHSFKFIRKTIYDFTNDEDILGLKVDSNAQKLVFDDMNVRFCLIVMKI